MKKPLSNMSSTDFGNLIALLGLKKWTQVAGLLGRRPSTISAYVNGTRKIPVEVAIKLNDLRRKHALLVQQYGDDMVISIPEVAAAKHRSPPDDPLPKFKNRLKPADTATFPAVRISKQQMRTLLESLDAWNHEVRRQRSIATNPNRIRERDLELVDIKTIASYLPRELPYDVCIERGHWHCIARALLFHGRTVAHARSLYQTWRTGRARGSLIGKAHLQPYEED